MWKDVTSWSKDDTAEDRKTPKTWAIESDGLRVVVTRHRDYDASTWVLCCHQFRQLDERPLNAKDVNQAKWEALVAVRAAVEKMLATVKKMQEVVL